MNKHLVIISEATIDFTDRYTPIVQLIRQNNPSINITGIFVRFLNLKPQIFKENYFDKLYFPEGYDEASALLSCFIDCEALFLLSHIPSSSDCLLYRLAACFPGNDRHLLLRNCVSLQRFFDNGHDDAARLHSDIKRARRKEREIRIKVFFFSSIITALVLPARFLSKVFYKKTLPSKKILFIKLDVLGDMIVTIPYIKALREEYSHAEITIMASSHGAGLLREQHSLHPHGLYNRLLVWDAPWHFSSKSVLGLSELKKILMWLPMLWRERFDIVIQPVVFGTGLAFALLTLGDRIIAAVDPGLPLARALRPLLTDPVDIVKDRIYHMQDYAAETLAALNITRKYDAYRDLEIDAEAAEKVEEYLKTNGHSSGLVIAINVGARNPVRILDGNKLVAVISDCKSRFQATIVLLGTEKERVLAESISALCGFSVINAAGQLTFNELTALVAKSDLVITADTGLMHLAAAVKSPIVAIYGAGLVGSCYPLNSDYVIVKKELGCSGCADRCFASPPAPCMEAITPNEVLAAITVMLKGRDSGTNQSLSPFLSEYHAQT